MVRSRRRGSRERKCATVGADGNRGTKLAPLLCAAAQAGTACTRRPGQPRPPAHLHHCTAPALAQKEKERTGKRISFPLHTPGQVIIPAPYWVSYPEMAKMAGAVPRVVDTTPEEGFLMSPEKLRATLTPASRLLILCTPSNPSGAVYSRCAGP